MSGPMHGAMRAKVEKPKDFKKNLTRLFRMLLTYRISVIFVVIFAILSTIFTVVGPAILANATNILYDGAMMRISNPSYIIDLTGVYQVLLLAGGLYLISAITSYIQSVLMVTVTQKVTFSLRSDIANKINRLTLKTYDTKSFGDILSRITNDVDTINNSLQQTFVQLITSLVTILGILGMMLSLSISMTLIALISLPISLFFVTRVVKKGQQFFQQRSRVLGALNGHIEEMFGGHAIVKVFNGEQSSIETFDRHNEQLRQATWKSEFISGMMMPIVGFIGNLGYVAVVLAGAMQVISGRIQVGTIQAFIQYIRNFNQPINQVANIANVLQSTVAAAERVFEFLDEEEEVETGHLDYPTTPIAGKVTFKNIDFGYSTENVFIKNLSFDVEPGQKVAIVGPTGAGKTTLINLLMRFYDVLEGDIEIDGVSTKKYKRESVRKMFGMVLQDTWLFTGSIYDNISFGVEHATESQVIDAAKAAKVDHFVRTLPDGYQSLINEEATNISTGQKQLITIARAFLADTPILILDEATSSVDTRTEILIQKAMESLMQNRTSFVIAHRLSTIKDADLILVMNHGSIVEQGTHTQLLAQNGFYTQLYNSQFEDN
ncbi:MAG TPA: multidrug ABC transporter ATP-binding protein [Erysipelotrichaceae bacterium]|nr:multidrug ABC transporter ATP-binding protein [Erysipelotrichaceae bacterium]